MAALVLLMSVLAVVRNPQLSRCILLTRFRLIEIEPNVFVDPGMDTASRYRLRTEIALARARVSRFIGTRHSDPVIVAGGLETYRRYGTSAGPDFSMTYTSPLGDYVVIGRSGLNADCIGHELMHVELRQRLGLFPYRRIPTWFDEGLAMYVDHRPEFGEEEYQRITNGGREASELNAIAGRKEFYTRDPHKAYVTSKHVFSEWYRIAGYDRLMQLMDRVAAGEDFAAVYAELSRQSLETTPPAASSPIFVTAQKPARTL